MAFKYDFSVESFILQKVKITPIMNITKLSVLPTLSYYNNQETFFLISNLYVHHHPSSWVVSINKKIMHISTTSTKTSCRDPRTCGKLLLKNSLEVLKLDCTLESPGELYKLLLPGSHPRDSNLIGTEWSLSVGIFKGSPGDSNPQPKLRSTVLNPCATDETINPISDTHRFDVRTEAKA